MAIYHCSIKIGSRGAGRSAAAAAAYRAADKVQDRETGILHDFERKSGVVHKEIMLPENAPEAFRDRETLWNTAQAAERAKNGQIFREVEIALPNELTREQQIELVRNYCRENFVRKGMCVDWSLHDKGDGNPHAHIMLTMRSIDEKGRFMPKRRTEYARDENGEKIPELDKNGKQKIGKNGRKMWQRIDRETNDWNSQENAEKWRESWARECNKYLSEGNQIDHRSFERRGIDKIPMKHEGFAARQMERRGGIARSCEVNREIKSLNAARHQLEMEQRGVIIDLAKARQERTLRNRADELQDIRNKLRSDDYANRKSGAKDRAGASERVKEQGRTKTPLRRANKSNAGRIGRNRGRSFDSFEQRRYLPEMSFFDVDPKEARAGVLLPEPQRRDMEIDKAAGVRNNSMQRTAAGGTDERARGLKQKDAITRRKRAEKRAGEKKEIDKQSARISATAAKIGEIKANRAYQKEFAATMAAIKGGAEVLTENLQKATPGDLGKYASAAIDTLTNSLNPANINPINAITNTLDTIEKLVKLGEKNAMHWLKMGKAQELGLPKDWLYMTQADRDAYLAKKAISDDYDIDKGKSLMSGYRPSPAQQLQRVRTIPFFNINKKED